jgi:cytochrome c-type biogenesis protein CcmH
MKTSHDLVRALARFAVAAGIAAFAMTVQPVSAQVKQAASKPSTKSAAFDASACLAADAFGKGLAANPKVGNDPEIWCEFADALGMAQGGSLTGRPYDLVMHALVQNPGHPRALEMAGSASFEARDYAAAARYWRELAAQLAPASPPRRELDAAIARADLLASTDAP